MLENIFGKQNELVRQALTHPSYTKENNIETLENYERLEFFGDSVLKLFTSKLLYELYPEASEGELSKIRSIFLQRLSPFPRSRRRSIAYRLPRSIRRPRDRQVRRSQRPRSRRSREAF